ncbi:ABC transporter ATP-binding protein [Streptomyces calidiresistens]
MNPGTPEAPDASVGTAVTDAPPRLEVTDLTVRFAGLTALDGVSFAVEPGSIHAVIGPNGAGKSTCFNVLSGVYRATSGSVRLGERELTGLPPERIAALGVARTFQNLALSDHATVADTMLLGRHRLTRTGFLAAGLRLPSAVREEARHRERMREIAAFLGLGKYLDVPAGILPYGLQKLVELGRALCMEPEVLLLDEPIAGMTPTERRHAAGVIAAVRENLGVSVLLVEHDMGVVMRLADTVTVLDFGRRIAHGDPERVQNDPEVARAYLGTNGGAETSSATPVAHPPKTTDTTTPPADGPAPDTDAPDASDAPDGSPPNGSSDGGEAGASR